MKKKNRFSIKTKHWVIIMTVICIGLIGLAASSRFSFAPLQQGAGYVISPFQKGINVMGSWLRDQTSGFQDAKKLQKEIFREPLKKETVFDISFIWGCKGFDGGCEPS